MLFIQDALEHEYAYAKSFYLPVVNVRRNHADLMAALACVYGVRDSDSHTQAAIKINRTRQLAINRVYDLARFALRMPVRGLILDPRYCDLNRLYRGFKKCVRCRPSGVIYPPSLQRKKFYSCTSDHFCPACWARLMAAEYRKIQSAFQKLFIAEPRVTAHLVSFDRTLRLPEISAATYTTPDVFSAAVYKLNEELDLLSGSVYRDSRRACPTRRAKKNRVIRGAYWRVIPVPTATGVTVHYRRVVLCGGAARPEVLAVPKYTMAARSLLVSPRSVHTATQSLVSFISPYPREYLTEDLELTGVCLNAVGARRCIAGAGVLRGVGRFNGKKER